jgi:cyanophycin synthetase
MELQSVLALRGPNVWAHFPVLEAWLELGEVKSVASNEIDGFNDRLMGWLPSLVEHRCSVGTRGGFFERLRRGTYLAHILEHITLELQSLAGTPVGFGRTRLASGDSLYRVAVEYQEEELGRACLETARRLCLAAVADEPFDVAGELQSLRELARRVSLPPATAALVEAARRRNIPVRRLSPDGLVQLGYGARQHRVLDGLTDRTNALAEVVARDWELTRNLLQTAGVPVPYGRLVSDAEDAWAAAQEVEAPVSLRPRFRDGPSPEHTGITAREKVLPAYDAVARLSSPLLVEQTPSGASWRLLIAGDGVLGVVPADQAQAAGKDGSGYVLTDGQAEKDLHPELAARAVDAVRAVGLDIATVEIVAEDLGRSLEEQGGAVIGVKARPDLAPFLSAAGSPVADAVFDRLFPDGQTGRIPLVAITGVNGKTTTTRFIAHLLAGSGLRVGMSCTEGIYVGGRRIIAGDCSGPTSAGAVLEHPLVEAAVLETARGGILRAGLGFDRCDVAVVTNIGEGDHLGIAGIDTLEQLALVKSTIVAAVAPSGYAVLKADDPHVANMAQYCGGRVIFFARDGRHAVIAQHRATGGRVVFVRDGSVILTEGEQETALSSLERAPLTHGGRIGFQIENTLAAAGAAWALGLSLETIGAGLETFAGGLGRVPGRFNLLEINGAIVVLDYSHNISALASLIEALAQFPHPKRTIIYSGSGDRRDCDLVRQGELLGDAFDRVILYEDPRYLRGLQEGRMTALFCEGMAAGSRVRKVDEVRSWRKAVKEALTAVRPGELLVIQPDTIDETVEVIRHHLATTGNGREVDFNEALASRAAKADTGRGWRPQKKEKKTRSPLAASASRGGSRLRQPGR